MFKFLFEHSFFVFEHALGNHRYFVFRTNDEKGNMCRGTIRIPANEHGTFGFEFSNPNVPQWFTDLQLMAEEKSKKAFRLHKLFE